MGTSLMNFLLTYWLGYFNVLGYQSTPSRTSCTPCAAGFYCPDPRFVMYFLLRWAKLDHHKGPRGTLQLFFFLRGRDILFKLLSVSKQFKLLIIVDHLPSCTVCFENC